MNQKKRIILNKGGRFSIFCLILSLFLLIRLPYVSGTYHHWGQKVYSLRTALLDSRSKALHEGQFDKCENFRMEYNKYTYDQLYTSVYSFNKMMFCFWKWNISSMVENRPIFDYINERSEELGLSDK